MKNLLFIVLAIFSLTSCGDDTNLPAPYYSIEGKWIWSPSDNRADANTMYEFVDGIRYTYYLSLIHISEPTRRTPMEDAVVGF